MHDQQILPHAAADILEKSWYEIGFIRDQKRFVRYGSDMLMSI